ncbi:hypothetical protein SANTM175S_09422 [Streptomyces antimycoticus]
MSAPTLPSAEGVAIGKEGLVALVDVLRARGYTVVGPTVRDGAIVLQELESAAQLPYGWGVDLEAGQYRLRSRTDGAAFANAAGPQSWKTFLHPARVRQWTAERAGGELVIEADDTAPPRFAFLGVRSCDLRAIAVQDRILTAGPHSDPVYRGRRAGAFLVAVECTEPGGTCFCVSMGTGPAAGPGYDLVLTELVDDGGHRFWARAGSAEGAEILAELPGEPASEAVCRPPSRGPGRTTSPWWTGPSPPPRMSGASTASAGSPAALVTIGACATAGDIQALRNFADVEAIPGRGVRQSGVHRHPGHLHAHLGACAGRLRVARLSDRTAASCWR